MSSYSKESILFDGMTASYVRQRQRDTEGLRQQVLENECLREFVTSQKAIEPAQMSVTQTFSSYRILGTSDSGQETNAAHDARRA